MVSRVDVKMDSTPTLIEAKYWEPSCIPHADHVRGRGLAVASTNLALTEVTVVPAAAFSLT